MFFIIIFSLLIAVITITELPIFIVILSVLFSLLLFLARKTKKIPIIRWILLLVLCSRQVYQRRYSPLLDQQKGSYYLSTGIITDKIGSGKYIYKDQEKTYLLYTTKQYIPWNQVRLVARYGVQPSQVYSLTTLTIDNFFYSGFNSQKWIKMKGYSNILYETNAVIQNTGTMNWFSKIRYQLTKKIQNTYKNTRTAGLIIGILIGDKSLFSKSDYQLFVDSGLVHIIAVSGGNIVMLVSFLMIIAFFLPFYPRIVFILSIVICYGILCWMDSSVVRAVLMWSLSLLALLFWRSKSLWKIIGIVHTAMLLYNPYFLVYDVGYILSFSAVIGIIFFDHLCPSNGSSKKIKNLIINFVRKDNLKPSIWATLGIFPVIIFFMSKINIGWILWNMFVLPLIPLIMIWWLVWVFLPVQLQKYCIIFLDILVARIYKIAQIIDNHGISIVAHHPRIKFTIFWITILMMATIIFLFTQKQSPKKHLQNTQKVDRFWSIFDDMDSMYVNEIKK